MKEEEKSEEFCRISNLGLLYKNPSDALQSTLEVPGESLSEAELI